MPLNIKWDIDQVVLLNVTVCSHDHMHIELLSFKVVLLGLLLSVLYTVSIVNCLYWLRLQQLVRENILQANEGHMIDREERRLHNRQVDPVGDQDDYVQRDQIDVDSNNFQSSDDSASSYTGSANICFAFPVVCSEDAEIHGQHTLQKIINPPFIAVNTQCGGESEEPLKIFPDIELDDSYPFGCVQ